MTKLQWLVLGVGITACVYVSLAKSEGQAVRSFLDEAEKLSILIEIEKSKR